jgi:hypothetical protein
MPEDDFSIVPEEDIKKLKSEVAAIKQNPLASSPGGQDLLSSVNNLNTTLSNMVNLFQNASESMKKEDQELDVFSKQIKPLMEKIDSIIDQNEKIAKGIVALADIVRDSRSHSPAPGMPESPIGKPQGMAPPMGAPKPGLGTPTPGGPQAAPPKMGAPSAPMGPPGQMPPPGMAPPKMGGPAAPPGQMPPMGGPGINPQPLPRSGESPKKRSLFGFK